MVLIDTDRQYELDWRDKILTEFERNIDASTVTCMWPIIPYHLDHSWVEEVLAEIKERFNYKPISWAVYTDTVSLTFKSCGGRMDALQKACYETT